MYFSGPLPFDLGETLKGKDDDGNLIGKNWLGRVYVITSRDVGNTAIARKLANRQLLAVPLRNESGATMLGKRGALLTRTAGYSQLESVNGYAATLAEKGVVIIDEYLATNGVADDDIFWGIFAGPVTVLTPEAGAAFNGDIAVGAQLVAATASATNTTVAGRVSNVTLPGTTGATVAHAMAANQVGVAMSARTTGETNSDLLINASLRLW